MEEALFVNSSDDYEFTEWSMENNYSSPDNMDVSSESWFEGEDIISSTPKSDFNATESDKDISYSDLYGNGLNESTLKAENIDLYSDLILIEEERKKAEQNRDAEYERVMSEFEDLHKKIKVKDEKIEKLTTENINLKKNMCSLYKTFKSEIERKEWLAKENKTINNFRSQRDGKSCPSCKQKCSYCNKADERPCKRKRSESSGSNNERAAAANTATTNSEPDLPFAKIVNTDTLTEDKNVSQKDDNHKLQESGTHEVQNNDTDKESLKTDTEKLQKNDCNYSQKEGDELHKEVTNNSQNEEDGQHKDDPNNSQKSDNLKLQSDDQCVSNITPQTLTFSNSAKDSSEIDDKFYKVVPESVRTSFFNHEQSLIRSLNRFKESLIKNYDNPDSNFQSPPLDNTSKEPRPSRNIHSDNRSQIGSGTYRETSFDFANKYNSRYDRNRKYLPRDERLVNRDRRPNNSYRDRRKFDFHKR